MLTVFENTVRGQRLLRVYPDSLLRDYEKDSAGLFKGLQHHIILVRTIRGKY